MTLLDMSVLYTGISLMSDMILSDISLHLRCILLHINFVVNFLYYPQYCPDSGSTIYQTSFFLIGWNSLLNGLLKYTFVVDLRTL